MEVCGEATVIILTMLATFYQFKREEMLAVSSACPKYIGKLCIVHLPAETCFSLLRSFVIQLSCSSGVLMSFRAVSPGNKGA